MSVELQSGYPGWSVYTGQQSDAYPEIPWRQKISKYQLQLLIMYSGVPVVAKSVMYLHQLYT